MSWNLSFWNLSRSSRPRQQRSTRLFESLENRALMAGDLHAMHAPPPPHGHAPAVQVRQHDNSLVVAHIPRAGNSGSAVTVAPGVPTGVTAEAYAGAVKLSWTAPLSTSGTGRIGYVVQYSTDSGATWTAVNHRFGETHAVVPMLTNGTPYVFEVAAVNKVGQSAFSVMSAAVTPVASTTLPTSGRNRGNAGH